MRSKEHLIRNLLEFWQVIKSVSFSYPFNIFYFLDLPPGWTPSCPWLRQRMPANPYSRMSFMSFMCALHVFIFDFQEYSLTKFNNRVLSFCFFFAGWHLKVQSRYSNTSLLYSRLTHSEMYLSNIYEMWCIVKGNKINKIYPPTATNSFL